jgi:hypothetical protein
MPSNFLGMADWKRSQQTRMMVWVVVASVFFACLVAAVMLLMNGKR